ncbi:hypothetical protein DY000_02022440 [Brassica cretica]|uniref:PPIase FKBP-type domain-containing protein n=2 Tax=Brassica TaxID=3705 RepID=A0ABQ7EIK8_BRACR|nr:hypothetical protein DY000_02022440 [Brassica cretica]
MYYLTTPTAFSSLPAAQVNDEDPLCNLLPVLPTYVSVEKSIGKLVHTILSKTSSNTVFLKKGRGEGEEPFEFKTDEEQVIDGLDRAVMKMKKQAKALKVACNLNDAACKLKLQDYKQLCTKVLELESANVKALYRRAQAYMELADFDLAEFDVKKALEIDPNNREVKVEQRRLKEKMKEFNKKEAKFLREHVCEAKCKYL